MSNTNLPPTTQISAKTVVSKKLAPPPQIQRPNAEANVMRLNSIQRQTVRVALATGATVAALIGAQTLALLDRSAIVKPITLGTANPSSTGVSGADSAVDSSNGGASLDLSGSFDNSTAVPPAAASTNAPSLDLSGLYDVPANATATGNSQPTRHKVAHSTPIPDALSMSS